MTGNEIIKKLSSNDIGLNGAHQAGILIPKQQHVLAFFPALDPTIKNPRQQLIVHERRSGERWEFNYIYYNNRLFGGTRNEFRMTCMTQYLRAAGANVGDELVFTREENESYLVDLMRGASPGPLSGEVLVLKGGWKIINSKGR